MKSPSAPLRSATCTRPPLQRWALRPGFTMIEVLIVLVLLVLFMSIAVVRFSGSDRREMEYAADELAGLLTLYAHRESIGFGNIALGFDPAADAIMLLERRGDPADPGDPPRWDFDRFVKPVLLPDGLRITAVRVDGRSFDHRGEWFIPVIPGEGRPTIEINLDSPATGITCLIFLPAYRHSAQVLYEGDRENVARTPADLDALGRDREVW